MSQDREITGKNTMGSARKMVYHRVRAKKATFFRQLPLLAGLVFVWCALWQDFSVGAFFFGTIVAVVVVKVFYLPPIEISNRFHCGWLVIFIGVFLWDLITESFKVFWAALSKGNKTKSAVVGVLLRPSSDLIITLTALTISLIPGSTVLEIDRSTATIYLHVLDVQDMEQVEQSRQNARKYEELFIMICGTKNEAALLKRVRENVGNVPQGKDLNDE